MCTGITWVEVVCTDNTIIEVVCTYITWVEVVHRLHLIEVVCTGIFFFPRTVIWSLDGDAAHCDLPDDDFVYWNGNYWRLSKRTTITLYNPTPNYNLLHILTLPLTCLCTSHYRIFVGLPAKFAGRRQHRVNLEAVIRVRLQEVNSDLWRIVTIHRDHSADGPVRCDDQYLIEIKGVSERTGPADFHRGWRFWVRYDAHADWVGRIYWKTRNKIITYFVWFCALKAFFL